MWLRIVPSHAQRACAASTVGRRRARASISAITCSATIGDHTDPAFAASPVVNAHEATRRYGMNLAGESFDISQCARGRIATAREHH